MSHISFCKHDYTEHMQTKAIMLSHPTKIHYSSREPTSFPPVPAAKLQEQFMPTYDTSQDTTTTQGNTVVLVKLTKAK